MSDLDQKIDDAIEHVLEGLRAAYAAPGPGEKLAYDHIIPLESFALAPPEALLTDAITRATRACLTTAASQCRVVGIPIFRLKRISEEEAGHNARLRWPCVAVQVEMPATAGELENPQAWREEVIRLRTSLALAATELRQLGLGSGFQMRDALDQLAQQIDIDARTKTSALRHV